MAYAIPGFLFAVMLLVVFAGGSISPMVPAARADLGRIRGHDVIQQIGDYFWHITLPVLASTISAFATLTLLTKNSFLDEIKKQYVMTAKAKGLPERRVLYGHVFRNAMLIVIAGFPGGLRRRVLWRIADYRDDLLARRVWGGWGLRRRSAGITR